MYLVLELLRGPELLTRIRQSSSFTEAEAARIMRRLVSALRYLHTKGIVHRDLKPENIIFDGAGADADLRLVDFGFARSLGSAGHPLTTPCYTLHYAAPEVLHKWGTPLNRAFWYELKEWWEQEPAGGAGDGGLAPPVQPAVRPLVPRRHPRTLPTRS